MADAPEQDEKTEDATLRRRDEARDKGQVAYSSELVVAAMLVAAAGSLAYAGPRLAADAGSLIVSTTAALPALGRAELAVAEASGILSGALRTVLPAGLMLLAPVMAVGLVCGLGQVGVRFAGRAVELDLERLNPLSGWKKLFGARSWTRTLLGAAKIACVATAVVSVTLVFTPDVSGVTGTEVRPFLASLRHVVVRAGAAGIAVLVALSIIDLVFQRAQHGKDLRMTKKEVRDEAKNTDGDPLVRSRIRQIQRELAGRRMMADVPDATVVVTNPTHVAVALRYDDAGAGAPVVVAKGLDEVAEAIKAVAREHEVVVYEEPPLARALHRSCDIGDPVPAELFEAVAAVLAYVYRIQGRVPARA